MKKMATIVLGLMLVLTLVGCGNNAQSSDKRHKNHAGYVYRKSMAAQGTLRSFDLATRFPTFVYYRNDC